MPISNPVPRSIDDKLRAYTWRVIQRGLDLGLPPAKQWWNLTAKLAVAESIADQEVAIHQNHRNDAIDALRHAEWSRRMSEEIDPLTS